MTLSVTSTPTQVRVREHDVTGRLELFRFEIV